MEGCAARERPVRAHTAALQGRLESACKAAGGASHRKLRVGRIADHDRARMQALMVSLRHAYNTRFAAINEQLTDLAAETRWPQATGEAMHYKCLYLSGGGTVGATGDMPLTKLQHSGKCKPVLDWYFSNVRRPHISFSAIAHAMVSLLDLLVHAGICVGDHASRAQCSVEKHEHARAHHRRWQACRRRGSTGRISCASATRPRPTSPARTPLPRTAAICSSSISTRPCSATCRASAPTPTCPSKTPLT